MELKKNPFCMPAVSRYTAAAEGSGQGHWIGSRQGKMRKQITGSKAEMKMSERGGSIRCSFCSKPMGLVGKLIAGNGSYICNECVLMCMEICYPQVDLSPAKGGDHKADSPAGASGTASGAAPATPKGATETAPAQPGPENGTSVMKEDFLLFAKKLEPLVNLSNPGTGEISDAR